METGTIYSVGEEENQGPRNQENQENQENDVKSHSNFHIISPFQR